MTKHDAIIREIDFILGSSDSSCYPEFIPVFEKYQIPFDGLNTYNTITDKMFHEMYAILEPAAAQLVALYTDIDNMK